MLRQRGIGTLSLPAPATSVPWTGWPGGERGLLLTARELFVAEGDEARHARWPNDLGTIVDGIEGLPGVTITLRADAAVPTLVLTLSNPQAALALYDRLVSGRPSVHLDPVELASGSLTVNAMCLASGDAPSG